MIDKPKAYKNFMPLGLMSRNICVNKSIGRMPAEGKVTGSSFKSASQQIVV